MIQFDSGQGGLDRAVITTPQAEAHVYLHGAHVTHYQRTGERPVLFLSRQSWFEPGKPIRGGVPICFPWFGAKADDPDAPNHGFARLEDWEVESSNETELCLKLQVANPACEVRHRIQVGESLWMSLEVTNTAATAIQFEEALHTYLAVSDIRQVSVDGFEHGTYLDYLDGFKLKLQGWLPVRFTAETDRIYLATQSRCVLEDAGWHRRLIVEKSGSQDTVIWNPWIAKARALPDLGDDEWPHMLCIETCNVRAHAVTLPPGQIHKLTARIHPETEQHG